VTPGEASRGRQPRETIREPEPYRGGQGRDAETVAREGETLLWLALVVTVAAFGALWTVMS